MFNSSRGWMFDKVASYVLTLYHFSLTLAWFSHIHVLLVTYALHNNTKCLFYTFQYMFSKFINYKLYNIISLNKMEMVVKWSKSLLMLYIQLWKVNLLIEAAKYIYLNYFFSETSYNTVVTGTYCINTDAPWIVHSQWRYDYISYVCFS